MVNVFKNDNFSSLFLDVLKEKYCRFTNSWLSDEADLEDEESLGLIDIAAEVNKEVGIKIFTIFGTIVFTII